jgi:copper homeostasis protein
LEGAQLIKALIDKADDRIILMPGSGVRADNILEIAEATGAVEFHTSARIELENKISVDENEILKIREKLASL